MFFNKINVIAIIVLCAKLIGQVCSVDSVISYSDLPFSDSMSTAGLEDNWTFHSNDGNNVWENQYGFDPLDPSDAFGDFDGDGLTNLDEYNYSTNPINFDTDGDGINDFEEINSGLDPLLPNTDCDEDGIFDYDDEDLSENDNGLPSGEKTVKKKMPGYRECMTK